MAKESNAALVNVLTPRERAEGWTLLFDGKTTAGWRGLRQRDVPTGGWVVEEGALKRVTSRENPAAKRGDIITDRQFENFQFVCEWKIAPRGNSGIKYPIDERRGATGFEYQLLDDARHPDARVGPTRQAGALYDLIAPDRHKTLRPVGEWNQARIVVDGRRVEHWLNGAKIVAFERGSDDLKARIARSKYKNMASFGEVTRGHILLQDHGDNIWFRNIKVRELRPARP
jgi:hypothetical protein